MNGAELAYRQQFRFLPGLLKGLGVSANYTYLETKGTFFGPTLLRTDQIVNFVPRSGNVRLTYTYRRFAASAGLNYSDHYPLGYSLTSPASNWYYDALTTLDLGASYKIRSQATVYVEVSNLTEKASRFYTYTEDRTRFHWIGAMTVKIGVHGHFSARIFHPRIGLLRWPTADT